MWEAQQVAWMNLARRTATLALLALLPLALSSPTAAALNGAYEDGATASDVEFVEAFTLPSTGAPRPAAALSTRVGILPSALRPITEYRTAPVAEPLVDVAAPAAATGPIARLAPGPLGVPGIMMHAYKHAADLMATVQPSCNIAWNLLAGIGKVESGHASGGQADANGNTTIRILGPVLDGHLPGNAIITDSDGGALDGDASYDRAVGPMQFMPGTWKTFGADGNNDGVVDPNNVYDAAFAAGRLLCSTGGDLSDITAAGSAILRYNHSTAYVQNVQAWALAYGTGAYPTESELPPIGAEDKSIDAAPDLTPVPTPDTLPPPEETPAPALELAPGVSIPLPELPALPELPCLIGCPPPPA